MSDRSELDFKQMSDRSEFVSEQMSDRSQVLPLPDERSLSSFAPDNPMPRRAIANP